MDMKVLVCLILQIDKLNDTSKILKQINKKIIETYLLGHN